MASPKTDLKDRITESSGNVFTDLGFRDAEERKTKVQLAAAINEILGQRGVSQVEAARRLRVTQPKVSALLSYKLSGFSVERLMHFLTALDRDVEIVIRNKPRTRRGGRIVVTAA
jgi:predicted XRE-type DNA-binding protein